MGRLITENDIDNTTIIINENNKLAATLQGGATEMQFEEVSINYFLDDNDNSIENPFSLVIQNGETFPVTKMAKISGTDWYVLGFPEGFNPIFSRSDDEDGP